MTAMNKIVTDNKETLTRLAYVKDDVLAYAKEEEVFTPEGMVRSVIGRRLLARWASKGKEKEKFEAACEFLSNHDITKEEKAVMKAIEVLKGHVERVKSMLNSSM